MRIDNVYSEKRINYPWESSFPASPEERSAIINLPDASGQKDSLPALYKRSDINTNDYVLKLSSGDVRISDAEGPVLQGVFEMDADPANEMELRYSSWAKTVSGILGREIQKGVYINRVV